VHLEGRPLRLDSPADAIRAGIVLVPEDRKLQGLIVEHGIGENMAYSNLDRVAAGGWVRASSLSAFADSVVTQFGVKGRSAQPASALSGGNQQKVVIAKWLARAPKVVVLDEPTRGIDVGARSSIYDIIVGLAAKGVAVVVVSSDLEEVLGVSNRVLVLAKGQQAGILDRSEATDVSIMELATS
jgi:ribose transport system ATP-binding protein